MSIQPIDPNFKVSTTEDGIFEYSHPECSAIITSDYRIMNARNRKPLKVYENPRLIGGQISARFKNQRSNFSFGRLLALMAGHDKDGYYRIIDVTQPLTLKNITTFKDYMKAPSVETKSTQVEPVIIATTGEKQYSDIDIMIENEVLKPYLPYYERDESGLTFKTEDGLIFNDRVKALGHQLNIDKGKELANLVLDGKGGWVLAEQVYRTQVPYFNGVPLNYDFRAIMDNNDGIEEIGEQKYVVKDGVHPHKFENKESLEKWVKAKALIDFIIDQNYDPVKISNLIH